MQAWGSAKNARPFGSGERGAEWLPGLRRVGGAWFLNDGFYTAHGNMPRQEYMYIGGRVFRLPFVKHT